MKGKISARLFLASLCDTTSRMCEWVAFFAIIIFVVGREDFTLTKMLCIVIGSAVVAIAMRFLAFKLDERIALLDRKSPFDLFD